MFHTLNASNTDALMGLPQDQLTTQAWTRIYRGLSHTYVKSQFQQNLTSLSPDAQTFANLFCDLQDERHNADYNALETLTAQEAASWLDNAEVAITNFLRIAPRERAAIAILTLVRNR